MYLELYLLGNNSIFSTINFTTELLKADKKTNRKWLSKLRKHCITIINELNHDFANEYLK